MRLVDSRRVPGPSLSGRVPGVIAEVALEPGDDPARLPAVAAAWARALAPHLPAETRLVPRVHQSGVTLFAEATLDVLLPLTDVNEWAVACALAIVDGAPPPALDPALLAAVEAARDPALLALLAAADDHGLPALVDEDTISLGSGARQVQHARSAPLPAPSEVPWATLGRVPVALVTGTNGKTTTARLVARMARHAGWHVGASSSDGITIDEQAIKRGDYSGPEAARTVLRRPDVDVAVLETARGGILRRGLAVTACDAALVTNVSADHLGDYGVHDVATMAAVKGVVASVAKAVVLKADDPLLAELAARTAARVVLFALDGDVPALVAHRGRGGEAWWVRDGRVICAVGGRERTLVAVAECPLTFGGAARYNVENLLAACALAAALGVPDAAIGGGARSFSSQAKDNPGRGNVTRVGDVTVILDFGHNPVAVRAALGLARHLGGTTARCLVTIGLPGDREDAAIREVAEALVAGGAARVLARDLTGHLRGRAPGEVPGLLARACVDAGLPAAAAGVAADELAAYDTLLAEAAPGDVVLVLAHLDARVAARATPLDGR